MSSTIEYRHAALTLDRMQGLAHMQDLVPAVQVDEWMRTMHGDPAPFVFVESGCSNTIGEDGRPARSWQLCHFGREALSYAIRTAVFAEAGSTKLRGRDVSAEAYIKHYRAAIKSAVPIEPGSHLPTLMFRLDDRLFRETDYDKYLHDRVSRDPFTQYLFDAGYLHTVSEPGFMGMGATTYTRLLIPCDNEKIWMATMTWLSIHCDVPDQSFKRFLHLLPSQCHGLESWLLMAEACLPRKRVA